MPKSTSALMPRLVCRNVDAAIAFYESVLGAKLVERFATREGAVVHASLAVDGSEFSLTEDSGDAHNFSPEALGGSAVLLGLSVADPDATEARAVEAGAEVVFPVADQFYGRREGRFRDPFGHLWIVGKRLTEPSTAEVQRGVDEWAEKASSSARAPRAGRGRTKARPKSPAKPAKKKR